jgi:uncharacterized protein (DUF779 family)
VGEKFTGKKKKVRYTTEKGKINLMKNGTTKSRLKAQKHTQTISDIVDSRRGGQDEQSLEGS